MLRFLKFPLQYFRELKVVDQTLVVRSLSTVPYVSYREIAGVCVCVCVRACVRVYGR